MNVAAGHRPLGPILRRPAAQEVTLHQLSCFPPVGNWQNYRFSVLDSLTRPESLARRPPVGTPQGNSRGRDTYPELRARPIRLIAEDTRRRSARLSQVTPAARPPNSLALRM